MEEQPINWEHLRTPKSMLLPDIRRKHISIDVLHFSLNTINLSKHVTEEVLTQFETAKNLFLYSWHVYRFHNIADLHAIHTLELSLRIRFDQLRIKYRKNRDSLRELLDIAEDNSLFSEDDFPDFLIAAKHRARQRHISEQLDKLISEGLKDIEIDERHIDPIAADYEVYFLDRIFNSLIKTRNHYAHGTSTLTMPSLTILNLTKDIINLVYDQKNDKNAEFQNSSFNDEESP